MTKSELEQIYYLNRELKMWERELERAREKSLIRSPAAESPRGTGTSDIVAKRGNYIADLERVINGKKSEIELMRDRAVNYIIGIPDSLTRMIIYYRCVSLMNWWRVAYEVGGGNTEDSVKKVYYRYFEKSCPVCPD